MGCKLQCIELNALKMLTFNVQTLSNKVVIKGLLFVQNVL